MSADAKRDRYLESDYMKRAFEDLLAREAPVEEGTISLSTFVSVT